MAQQRQHGDPVGSRAVFSALVSMFVFDILRILSECIEICIGCIVASCILPGYGPAFSVKVTVENGRQGNDQCQGTDIYLYEPIRLPQNHSDSLVPLCAICTVQYRGAQILQHLRSHLKILGSRMVTCSKLLTEDSLILGVIVQN